MTNLDSTTTPTRESNSSRTTLEPANFPASAGRLCRDDRIVVAGADRGTISSSVIVAGDEIALYHIEGDPQGREYQEFQLPAH